MPTYPVVIPDGSDEADFNFTDRPGGRNRPYIRGTSIYVILFESDTAAVGHLEVWKSTDQGETWEQQDAANQPANIRGFTNRSHHFDTTSQLDLNVIPIVYAVYTDSSNLLRVKPFNLAQDAWGVTSAAGPTNPVDDVQASNGCLAARRPSGINDIDILVAYNDSPETVSMTDYDRVSVTTYDVATDTWSSSTNLFGTGEAEHYDLVASSEGPADGAGQGRTHWFARQGGFFALNHIVHRSIEANDAKNTQETVTGSTDTWLQGTPSAGNEIVLPLAKSFGEGGDIVVFRADSSSSMVWVEETVFDTPPTNAAIPTVTDMIAESITGDLRVWFDHTPDSGADPINYKLMYSRDESPWATAVTVHEWTESGLSIRRIYPRAHAVGVWAVTFGLLSSSIQQANYTQLGVIAPTERILNGIFDLPDGGFVVA